VARRREAREIRNLSASVNASHGFRPSARIWSRNSLASSSALLIGVGCTNRPTIVHFNLLANTRRSSPSLHRHAGVDVRSLRSKLTKMAHAHASTVPPRPAGRWFAVIERVVEATRGAGMTRSEGLRVPAHDLTANPGAAQRPSAGARCFFGHLGAMIGAYFLARGQRAVQGLTTFPAPSLRPGFRPSELSLPTGWQRPLLVFQDADITKECSDDRSLP